MELDYVMDCLLISNYSNSNRWDVLHVPSLEYSFPICKMKVLGEPIGSQSWLHIRTSWGGFIPGSTLCQLN